MEHEEAETEGMMAVAKEIRFRTDVYTRDAYGLAELSDAIANAPRDYAVQSVEMNEINDTRAYSVNRGSPICTLIVTMQQTYSGGVMSLGISATDNASAMLQGMEQKIKAAKAEAEAQLRREGLADDPFPGPAGEGTEDLRRIEAWYRRHPNTDRRASGVETLAEARLRYARETGGHPGDMPTDYHPGPSSEGWGTDPGGTGPDTYLHSNGDVYASRAAYENGMAPMGAVSPGGTFVGNLETVGRQCTPAEIEAKEAADQAAKSRAFQIEAIESTLRRQDESARPSGGVQPFANRMAFAEALAQAATSIRTMIPTPGGSDVKMYRDWLKGIAANCVRELERTGWEGRAAL